MRRLGVLLLAAVLAGGVLAGGVLAANEPPLPAPSGLVVDQAGLLSLPAEQRLTQLLTELREKTGAEIAVVTVESTAPLDDFTYAMRIAEAWKPGRRGEDTGVVFLVAVRDRRVRILVGYGLEDILPDGLVGAIQDQYVIPAFRAGRMEDGVVAGVGALAARIAASRGVHLEGAPRETPRPAPQTPLPGWALLLMALVLIALVLYAQSRAAGFRRGRRWGYPYGGFGGFGGGFGGGGGGGFGGFGGFGGGQFGGGGAGRSW